MLVFGPKAWVNHFEKCQFFDFLNFLFLWPRKAFFSFKIMVKGTFLAKVAKKKGFENGHFWTKSTG